MQKKLFIILIPIAFLIPIHSYSKIKTSENNQTIVFIRHGEKPLDKEFGQINCNGLNRALNLPKVLVSKFGKPNYIFAPNPSKEIGKSDQKYSYIRPLATIEPTAIQLGLPVNAQFGFTSVTEISEELLNLKYKNSLIFVSWEHRKLVDIVKEIYSKDKNNTINDIPQWAHEDYDSIYILKISKENESTKVTFSQNKQELNNLSDSCPFPIE